MKKITFIAAFILSTQLSFSQDMAAAAERATIKSEAMISSLGLNTEQAEQITMFYNGLEQKFEYIAAEPSFTNEQRTEQIAMNKEAETNFLIKLLTPEQLETYKQQQKASTEQKSVSKKKTAM